MDRVSRGSGFGGAVRYIFSNFKASFLCSSDVLAARDERRAISKMGVLAHRLRPDIKKPVWHQALRLPRGEEISHKKYREIAHEYMRRMGWNPDINQYVVIVSDDPEGQHIHIVANRVGVDSSVYLGKNENLISTRVCQELERDFGLTLTKGPKYVLDERGIPRAVYAGPKDKKAKKGEVRMLERQQREGKARPLPRKVLQRVLKSALAAGQAGGLAAFLTTAEAGGVRVLANVASTGRANGLSFETAGVPFKGSDLGDVYSWASLATTVRFDRSRDLALLEARSLRHVSRGALPPLGQPAQSTRQPPAPPAAADPIVMPPAAKEAAVYVEQYQPSYRARSAPVATDGRRTLSRGPSLDRLRSLPGGALDVAGRARHTDPAPESLVQGDQQLLVGVDRVGPSIGLRPGARATGSAAAGGLTRVASLLEAARLAQELAALPEEPAVLGEGMVLTVVVALPRVLDDYRPKAGRWGTLYVRKADDCLAVVDTGKRVKVAHVEADTVRAALALSASKWERLTLRGSLEFRRLSAREAVRLGLGDRIANPELQPLVAAELARLATARRQVGGTQMPTPTPSTSGHGVAPTQVSDRSPTPRPESRPTRRLR